MISDDLKYYLKIANKYTDVSQQAIRTMRAARTYASLNEAITELYNNMLWMVEKCEKLTKNIIVTYKQEEEITESEICDVTLALDELGNTILRFNKSISIYIDIYNELNAIEPVVSAKKTTKVAKGGKTIDKD